MGMSASTYQITSRTFLVQLLMILSLRPHRSVLAKNQILKMRRWRPLRARHLQRCLCYMVLLPDPR